VLPAKIAVTDGILSGMRTRQTVWLFAFAWLTLTSSAFALDPGTGRPSTPSALFGELYARVQTERLFPDSKTFSDAVPKKSPDAILSDYRARTPRTREALAAFVRERFILPANIDARLPGRVSGNRAPLPTHIAALWPALTRSSVYPPQNSSLLPLNWPYVVPGGRFRELYYWDSYFTMLGLVRDRRTETARHMVRNFADLIGRYGHIPNGTRTYYLSRSQPPFFYLMVGLVGADDRAGAFAQYLPALRAEHAFWMQGANLLEPGEAMERVVALADGAILNRYWDASPTPRDESWREDTELAAASARPPAELYRDIRAAAESGWDFSTRWLSDGRTLATLETTAIIPIDLNSLLFGLERAIAEGCARHSDQSCVSEFTRRASDRQKAVNRYLWDAPSGRFLDYQWQRQQRLDRPSAAMLYPLFTGLANAEQSRGVAAAVSATLLASGGLLSTPVRSGQQWDAPNGWAPHQWIAVTGLESYGHADLARTIATRWLTTVSRTYRETGKLLEKYDVLEAKPGGGGEYPLQDGFGWTNGVTRALLDRYSNRSPALGPSDAHSIVPVA
jgi:alpha,alpha-trehalase